MTAGPLLQVDDLSKEFPSGASVIRAVDGVSFTTDRGEITLVMGPSGSGKTTLLTMVGGLLRPTSGSIVLDGHDIAALDRAQLSRVRRDSIGFVFQTFNLLDALSAQENVELALNVRRIGGSAASRRAAELLELSGMAGRAGARTRDLSGGEKQRVSIARALANRPALLLADEPTASLDSANGASVMGLLADLARTQRTAVVVVSHDRRLASLADRILWLEDGRIVRAGTADPP